MDGAFLGPMAALEELFTSQALQIDQLREEKRELELSLQTKLDENPAVALANMYGLNVQEVIDFVTKAVESSSSGSSTASSTEEPQCYVCFRPATLKAPGCKCTARLCGECLPSQPKCGVCDQESEEEESEEEESEQESQEESEEETLMEKVERMRLEAEQEAKRARAAKAAEDEARAQQNRKPKRKTKRAKQKDDEAPLYHDDDNDDAEIVLCCGAGCVHRLKRSNAAAFVATNSTKKAETASRGGRGQRVGKSSNRSGNRLCWCPGKEGKGTCGVPIEMSGRNPTMRDFESFVNQ